MQATKTIIQVIIASLFFCSCKKDSDIRPPEYDLVFQLNDYMSLQRVDSVTATWEVNGSKRVVKLDSKGSILAASLNALPEGAGKLKLSAFSNIRFGGVYKSLWEYEKEVEIRHNKNYEFKAPTGFWDEAWKPRLQLTSPLGHAAIVALRPEDAFFKILNVGDDVEKLTVYRAYWDLIDNSEIVAEGTWVCETDCRNEGRNVVNENFFNFFPASIGNKTWDAIQIEVSYKVPVNMTIYVEGIHQF